MYMNGGLVYKKLVYNESDIKKVIKRIFCK